MEKNKYMRERIMYQREGQMALYKEANTNYNKCDEEITDNLVKQAKTICKPSPEDFTTYFSQFNIDEVDEAANIGEHISEVQARDYLSAWTRIQQEYNDELNKLKRLRDQGGEISPEDQAKIDNLLNLADDDAQHETNKKDLLFIQTGEDVEDIFLAFTHYKL